MKSALAWIALLAAPLWAEVRTYEGEITIPTYEHTGRETEPPLFANSTVTGMYPFTTYIMPFREGGPTPKTYKAIFVENEYLKLTYLPELGGRFFSLYDKLRSREVFYRNDVIKPAPYNPRISWPQSGIELTGPHDLHMLTLHSEPYWSNKIVRLPDGGISLVLGELDPVYQMKVNLSASLHPGIAAMEITVFCYNTRDARMPQMFWMNAALPATPKTRFIYPMSRTIGHTTAEIADWPIYNGIDYSWDRNNKNMLGVFGIDIYDNFQGAYQFESDYGVFRYADRRIVQGMKMWTFGYGPGSKTYEQGYTDHAGPYVEVQSGRHVWDGHYEWVAPHKVETWSEWWVPVAGTGGLTTLTRDAALNIGADQITLEATRAIPGAHLVVKTAAGTVVDKSVDFDPGKPLKVAVGNTQEWRQAVITVTDGAGKALLDYHRPDENPGRKEYTPFTKPLESPRKTTDEMSVEELTLAAEFKLKELDRTGATALLEKALARDPGYSRAHLLLGTQAYINSRYAEAAEELQKTIDRDPYQDEGYFYLAMAQFALERENQAERNLYYIWPNSAYFGEREYQLGRLAFNRGDRESALRHFSGAIDSNSYDLLSRLSRAVCYREGGNRDAASKELAEVDRIDPTDRIVQAERFLSGDAAAKGELLRLTGGQTQEAMGVSAFYRNVGRWGDAVRVLQLVEENNRDPWGTPPEFYYTLAYCLRRAGDPHAANVALGKARASVGKVDRFPYRAESEDPLAETVKLDPNDAVARFELGCFLYYHERPQEAIEQWEAAVKASPDNFSARRALGLAYAEQGFGVEKAAAQLERAVELNPAHVRTLNDLSTLYARAGRFDDQLNVLRRALERSPKDDDLAEGVLTANLNKGRYDEAERLVSTHVFAPRHRTYGLRDKYRLMRYAIGAEAFNRKDYSAALSAFESALKPPVSLGVDDFQFQASPRLQYYLGRTLEAMGRTEESRAAYEKGLAGIKELTGDRDSWNSENYFMVLSLERLGRSAEAAALQKHFHNFAETELEAKAVEHRAEARYLLALIRKHDGQGAEARKLMQSALDARPDLLAARLELRGDVLDPAGS